MAKKKSAKKSQKNRVVRERVIIKERVPKGFFERFKEVLNTPQERTRVKTVIVEKPIIIQEKPQRFSVSGSDDFEKFDSKNSRYGRKSIATGLGLAKKREEEEFEEKTKTDEEFSEEGDAVGSEDELPFGEEEFAEGSAGEDIPLDGEEGVDDLATDSSAPLQQSHYRSKAMFVNVWWKKAVLWAVLSWIIILAIELGMQALKLITVDLTRQWWGVLVILIVLYMVYFKFFEPKKIV